MHTNNFYVDDQYGDYEEQFYSREERRAQRYYKPKERKKSNRDIMAELTDATELQEEFKPSYQPSRYEREWLLSSLRPFYEEGLITDVLAVVKGGKEASVYRCEAHPATGERFLAAKVYRPRKFRHLRNDRMYREGRQTLSARGKAVKKSDHRTMRALGKKTGFGAELSHTSWLMYEYTTMGRLHEAGAIVPKPFSSADNAILMSYHGDQRRGAPTLNQVKLSRQEARLLFNNLLHNIKLMLQNDVIHGDLSAYNILYWQGEITIIDFPQVTNLHQNTKARFILQRDIKRVCEYFVQQGVSCNPRRITEDLWRVFGSESERILKEALLGESSRLEEESIRKSVEEEVEEEEEAPNFFKKEKN
ncbi:MAG: RIO1 family regulatory kinase/ATPase [Ardenticatenaceae bacterium]